ncbi:calmodulin-binding protein [Stieleria varia]|nr:calmodulin-binding protein [Stieleria varia]
MLRKIILAAVIAVGALTVADTASADQRAFGQAWGGQSSTRDWNRFYHYPYVYYPQNFWGQEYFRSADSMYHRYPAEMRIPVYNKKWHNYYPSTRRYHSGHHFILDVF